ncbi:MAG TPA: hypothetical protein PLM56_09180 [Cyclobacteriaceae bacterium]|nr:hypothetical protein [Cyclobacteriaceae bacterium]HRF33660.1 hypothetical protein [Cyclobacteriaceae bacterium]
MPKFGIFNPMAITIEKPLLEHFKGKTSVSASEILRFLKTQYPDVAIKTLQWRIYELKKKGILHHVSRGTYSFEERTDYRPTLSRPLKRLYNKINKGLPYATICVWDTRWFNEFTELQLFKHFLVIEAEKDVAEAIHNRLVSPTVSVFLDPDKEIFEKYIVNHDEVIIVKSMISEAPVMTHQSIVCASLEKLLVDCLAEPVMFSAQQAELDTIFKNAFDRYTININAMKRYARRRNKLKELEIRIQNFGNN